jgi:serine/threonine-protein kinase
MLVIFKKHDGTAEQTIDILPDSKLSESREAAQMLLGLPEHPRCKLVLERTKKELEDNLTFKEAGIKDRDKLILSLQTEQEIKPPQEVPPPPVGFSVSPPITSQSQTPPVSNDWKIAVITGSAIGIFMMLGLVVVSSQNRPPNPPPLPQSTAQQQSPPTSKSQPNEPSNSQITQSLSQQEAVDLIERWLQAKERIFAPPFDRDLAAELTTDVLYSDIIKPGGSIDWLRNSNAFYRFGVKKVDSVKQFVSDGDRATLVATVIEDRTLYVNGKIDKTQTDFTTKSVRYTFKKEDERWKIADYK